MFEVFEHARKVSRTDSQLYEDSVELQMFFIKKRDEICKNGEILLTPALSYMERHLQATIELEKKEKLPKEQREDEEKRKQQEEEAKEREVCGRASILPFQPWTVTSLPNLICHHLSGALSGAFWVFWFSFVVKGGLNAACKTGHFQFCTHDCNFYDNTSSGLSIF